MHPTKRVLSYGGGLDSFAMLVEGIRRNDKPDVVCFVDVGGGSRECTSNDPASGPAPTATCARW
jgi:hypothetical protein